MPKEKFVYNKHTLRFEKVQISLKSRLLKIFGFISAVIVASVLFLSFAFSYFPSPKEKMLIREIDQMSEKYEHLNKQIALMDKVLNNIQERDANVHRMMFGMDPIDKSLWEGGTGGHEKFSGLTRIGNSYEILANTEDKVEKLERQLVLQSKSLDTIMNLAIKKENLYSSLPIITPISADKYRQRLSSLSGFGFRLHPILKVRRMHTGVDFPAPRGTSIQVTGDGRISKIENHSSGYGKNVIVDHGYGYQTMYAHMETINVKEGQRVKRGQKIGTVGETGRATAPHVHYEVMVKGQRVNPIQYCLEGISSTEYKELVEMSQNSNISYD